MIAEIFTSSRSFYETLENLGSSYAALDGSDFAFFSQLLGKDGCIRDRAALQSYNRYTCHDMQDSKTPAISTAILNLSHLETMALSEVEYYCQKPFSSSRDWMKRYEGNSQLALQPKTAQDVSAILEHCNRRRLPVVPQVSCSPMLHQLLSTMIHTTWGESYQSHISSKS